MALILGNGGPSLLEASRIRSCKCSSYGRTQLKMEVGCSFNTHQSPCLRPQSYPWRQFNLSTKSRRPKSRSIFVSHIVAAIQQVEETYIMVKPDGLQRGLVGEIISRFEKKGFLLKGLKMFNCPKELAEEHYKDLKARSFFPGLVDYITSGPVVCMAWEGVGVVASARKLIGVTNPLLAEPGTIRGDLAINTGRNVIHGSDSPENGSREIALWFKEGEICHWTRAQSLWLSSDE